MKSIVNIINFVRGVEPRLGRNIDLVKPVVEQLRILRETGLCCTFLLQYDALISDKYISLIKENADICEVGLWLEVVEPQVHAAGGKWNGRYSWDWYNDVGFLIGYEPNFRLKLIDTAMDKFKEIFGYYPSAVGSWHIDAVSMKYLDEKYGVSAACICRDQVGTDGYTMQGGYYNQAYYPSINNMFCPASSEHTQINMPVFRMLGSDPMLAYDFQIFRYDDEKCPTLEPAQRGRNDKWSDWYFDEVMCKGRGICFAYTQTGQENSFGWERMKNGIEHQFRHVKELCDMGKLSVMTLGKTGEWYKHTFSATPAATYCSMSAWDGADRKSVWYSCKNYRTNVVWENGTVRIRDLYLFDDNYKEHYLTRRCDTHACEFRNLPVMDGTIYSTKEHPAGIYFTDGKAPLRFTDITYSEDTDKAIITLFTQEGNVKITLSQTSIDVEHNIPCLIFKAVLDKDRLYGHFDTADSQYANHNNSVAIISYVSSIKSDASMLSFTFNGFDYAIKALKGHFEDSSTFVCENSHAQLGFAHIKK